MTATTRNLALLIWPVAIVLAALWIDAGSLRWSPGMRAALGPGIYLVTGLGALVAWRFNHSNAVLSLALVAFAGFLLADLPAKAFGQPIDRQTIRHLGLALVAVDLAWLGSVAERGIVSPVGRTRLAILLTQAILAGLAIWLAPKGLADLMTAGFLPAKPAAFEAIPDLVVVAFAFSGGMLIVALVERADASAAAQFGGVIALGDALLSRSLPAALAIVALGALLLAAATVQDSYRAAFIDPLTGLPARRALDAQLRRLGDRYVVAMLDVDRFKTFNDAYGHAVGDQVLKLVGARLGEIGGGGKPFRYGGEEFTLVFPDRDADQAMPALEALRLAIEKTSFRLRARDRFRLNRGRRRTGAKGPIEVSVTVSIGVADGNAADGSPEETIKRADAALYRAKDGGRNRISR